jgi:hypothetical protein
MNTKWDDVEPGHIKYVFHRYKIMVRQNKKLKEKLEERQRAFTVLSAMYGRLLKSSGKQVDSGKVYTIKYNKEK